VVDRPGEAHIADALKKGAKVVTGGKRAVQGGSFFEPTVLTDVTTVMVITKEETFGPVAPLYRFRTDDEAIKMANDAPTLTLPRSRGREGRRPAPISTAATSAASGVSPRRSNTAASALTRASSQPRSRASAA
jgi:succinate-semialdehyde dehydrogenase/glutarate-semialdehyde dehydrogenase